MTLKVVFLDAGTLANTTLKPLQQLAIDLVCYESTCEKTLWERAKNADVLITNKVQLQANDFANLPKLKLVLVAATGVNMIDLTAAKSFGVSVCNVQGYAKHAVPQLVFALLLQLTNQVSNYHQAVRSGLWSAHHQFCLHLHPQVELAGKTLVIVGAGHLGRATAALANAFGMQVIFSERKHCQEARFGYELFEVALQKADVLSLHCPLTTDTHHLIDTASLMKMKPSAFLINTARGALIDEEALALALQQGIIAGAALDVLSEEPPPSTHPLLNPAIPNLVLTPHIAWATQEAMQLLVEQLAQNLTAYMRGQLIRQVS